MFAANAIARDRRGFVEPFYIPVLTSRAAAIERRKITTRKRQKQKSKQDNIKFRTTDISFGTVTYMAR